MRTDSPARGADIGWVSQLESLGYTWVDGRGAAADPLALLQDFGIDTVRLRVMVDPARTNYVTTDGEKVTSLLGFCDQDHVVAMARRCVDRGLKVFIDFHFSDSWADPAKQGLPASWTDHSLEDLQGHLTAHVRSVLTALQGAGVYPVWVQLGNEIPHGLLWGPRVSGKVSEDSGWDTLAALLNAGYAAVKAIDPALPVVLHVDRGYDNALFRWWFDSYQKAGGRWDVIGVSFYPFWQPAGTVDQLRDNLNDLVRRYHKDVLVCEVGGLASEPEATASLIRLVRTIVAELPDRRGVGVFYWEPEAAPEAVCGYSLGAARLTGPRTLQFTEAMKAFRDTEEP